MRDKNKPAELAGAHQPAPARRRFVRHAGGLALAASFVALLVGNQFLSFTYHPIQWVFLGLAGAYHSAVSRHDPDWRVGVGIFDAVLVLALDLALVALFYVYFRLHPG